MPVCWPKAWTTSARGASLKLSQTMVGMVSSDPSIFCKSAAARVRISMSRESRANCSTGIASRPSFSIALAAASRSA